ncbi:MAG: DUF2142 domain-containing protein [Anaerolineae bacterium]
MAQRRPWLVAVLAAYLLAALCYVFITPLWQAPDEPAHYNYVRHLATRLSLPILQPGDYPHDYLEELKATHFPPERPIANIRYESHQPPLYYILAAVVLSPLATGAIALQVYGLRLLSVALGLALLLLTYRLGGVIWPTAPGKAVALAAVATFVPMHTAISAAISNDILAEVLVTATVLQATKLWRKAGSPCRDGVQKLGITAMTGLLIGLCLVTKMTAFIALPLALLALLLGNLSLRQREEAPPRVGKRAGGLGSSLATLCLPALVLWVPWLIRNMVTYGLGDPFGQARHDAVVVGQLRTVEKLAQVGLLIMLRDSARRTFESFWGVFGWMGVPMHAQVYLILGLATALAAVGLILRAWRWRRGSPGQQQRKLLLFLVAWGLLSLAELIWYNFKFVQPQGRYLFIAMPMWAALLVEGLDGARWRGFAIAPALLAASVALYLLGLATGDRHTLAAVLLLAAALALAAWSLVSHYQPALAGAMALAALWLLDMAGALYYVNRYL